jgi:SAM-dependent methyltransferase
MAFEAYLTKKDATEIVYLNISEGEGDRFKRKANEFDINIPCTFIYADANTFDYSSLGLFDTIISVGAFHHMKNFEYIFPQLNKILRTDGVIYADEYVGPSKWRFSKFIVDIINQLLKSLPEELIACRKEVKREDFYNLWKSSNDPSEAIRSDELDSMLKKYFSLVEETPFGGTLLQPFFLTAHLKPVRLKIYNWHNTEIGKIESKKLSKLENELLKSGKIGKDYLYYIFKKK